MAGPEGNLPRWGVGVFTVLPVPSQGHSPGGKLGSNLVGSPGLQADLHQGKSLPVVQQPVVKHRLLNPLAGDLGHIGFPGLFIPAQQINIGSRIVLGTPVDHRLVFFLELILPNLPGELRGRVACQSVDHQSPHHLIQAVDRPHLGLGLPDGLSDQVGHPSRLVGGEHPKGLDADHQGLVLIQDFKHTISPLFAAVSAPHFGGTAAPPGRTAHYTASR